MRERYVIAITVLGVFAGAVCAQNEQPGSARDLFFAGLEEYKTGEAKKIENNSGNRSDPTRPSGRREPAGAPTGTGGRGVARKRTESAARSPLGLRCSILKMNNDTPVEVPVSTVFHSGDKIRVKVEVNDEGYLYIVTQGTSGKWLPLFPSPSAEDGSNRVAPGRAYLIPDRTFKFEGHAGTEKLFLVLSRNPEPTMSGLVHDLSGGKQQTPAEKKKPTGPDQNVLMAENRIVNDPAISELRSSTTRDLVLEGPEGDVNEKPGSKDASKSGSGTRDQGLYVVNTTANPQSRVVVDIKLVHR